MNFETWKSAWALLNARERKVSMLVLLVSLLAAGAQVAMVGSIMPFLQFISEPNSTDQSVVISFLRAVSGITDNYGFALFLGLASILTICLSNLVLAARSYAISRFSVMRIHTISTRLLRSYLGRPYEYFLNRNSGDIGKRILAETGEISSSFLQPAADLIASTLSAVFILVFLMMLAPVGTLVGIGCVLFLYLTIYRFAGRFLAKLGEIRAEQNKVRFQAIGEIFGGIKDIKIHDKEAIYLNAFERASKTMLQTHWKSRIASETPQFLIQAFFLSGVIAACLFMLSPADFDSSGTLKDMIPLLGVFAFAGQRIVPEIQKIYAALSKITYGAAALRNVCEDMQSPSSQSSPKPKKIDFKSSIALQEIGYSYPGSTTGISRLTTTIKKGQRVGIVGGTGAGKTTLVDILLGILAPSSGQIVIDDTPLESDAARLGWRQHIGYVPQQIYLVDGSISQNIAFGVAPEDIDHSKVEACARTAKIHDFIIEKMPLGYDTVTGDRGVMLSGGQKQRIGIARALYRDSDVLVMDEATSALDTTTEREIMEAIDDLPADITLIMIAHRLTTLRNCSKLIVMDDGKLVEEGTWADLAKSGGVFARQLESGNAA